MGLLYRLKHVVGPPNTDFHCPRQIHDARVEKLTTYKHRHKSLDTPAVNGSVSHLLLSHPDSMLQMDTLDPDWAINPTVGGVRGRGLAGRPIIPWYKLQAKAQGGARRPRS